MRWEDNDVMNPTKNYYNINSKNYFDKTANVQPVNAWREFVDILPVNAHILDAGCGSGRDSNHFLSQGFKVTSMDISDEMAKLASQNISQEVLVRSFLDIDEEGIYDAVWCYASLLHLTKKELEITLQKIHQSLHKGGVLFMCFKHGNMDGITPCGRYYFDMNDARYDQLNLLSKGWIEEKVWIEPCPRKTNEDRPDWYSILLRKK